MDVAIRKCANIRSKRHPDQRCQRTAVQGEFCSLHYKKPNRFVPRTPPLPPLNNYFHIAFSQFQKKIRTFLGLKAFKFQGPAANFPSLATNETDFATLDPIDSLPRLYRFSIADSQKQIWLFDIRSLVEELKRSSPLKNPYTSIPFSPQQLLQLQKRIEWLLKKKYSLSFGDSESVPPTYQQNAVQLCLFMDAHGYLTNVDWFLSLVPQQIQVFLYTLELLWSHRIGLSDEQKLAMYPEWNPELRLTPTIRSRTTSVALDHLITFLLKFVQASNKKELETLASMYVLMALTQISASCRRAYPWLALV